MCFCATALWVQIICSMGTLHVVLDVFTNDCPCISNIVVMLVQNMLAELPIERFLKGFFKRCESTIYLMSHCTRPSNKSLS
mmetsp:Transcript_11139/g.21225  ORF Transcript_11139/g.21225 Transcript_11139/m.21225 type:complete len:81 (+) Transcript_11139:1414-1656(+)